MHSVSLLRCHENRKHLYLLVSFHESSIIPAENLTKICIADFMLASTVNRFCISESKESATCPFDREFFC